MTYFSLGVIVLCFLPGISLIMVFLIRYLASIIVWVIVVLAVVASIGEFYQTI